MQKIKLTKKPAHLREAAKTALLVLLIATALLLFYASWLYGVRSGDMPEDNVFVSFGRYLGLIDERAEELSQGASASALPVDAALAGEGGLYGAPQGSEEAQAIYERVRPVLAEALGSAGEFRRVTDSQFAAALKAETAAYLEYEGEIPIGLLAQWLGVSCEAESRALHGVLLTVEEGGVRIYFRSVPDGALYCADTAAGEKTLLDAVAGYTANGAHFAFVDEEIARYLPQESIVMDPPHGICDLRASVPEFTAGSEAMKTLLETVEYNAYTARKYEDLDGTLVYVSEYSTLRIEQGGRITFSAKETRGGLAVREGEAASDSERMSAVVERARQVAEGFVSAVGGEGGVYLQRVSPVEDGYDVIFGVAVREIPVGAGGTSAEILIRVRSGVVTYADYSGLRYEVTEEQSFFLGHKQAAAASGLHGDGRLRLRYVPGEDGIYHPAWFAVRDSAAR